MSLKDDFLEALRSVKRDFFRDSEYMEPDEPAPPASSHSELEWPISQAPFPPRPHVDDSGFIPQNIAATGEDPSSDDSFNAPHSEPDDVVFEAFRQASATEDPVDDPFIQGAVHTGEDDNGVYSDEDDPGDTTPFRSFDPSTIHEGAGNAGDGGSRFITDFDGGVYGDDKTIISKNTIIRGALHTEDSVRLLGQVLGDIECKSNIVVAGKVRGNTTAANAYIFDAQVDGDVRCDDIINVSNDAWVLGNIRAQQAEINGKIKGNIEIRHTVSIGATSSVLGDISTDELEIKRGAFINGQVMMYSPSRDVLDRFDQFKD